MWIPLNTVCLYSNHLNTRLVENCPVVELSVFRCDLNTRQYYSVFECLNHLNMVQKCIEFRRIWILDVWYCDGYCILWDDQFISGRDNNLFEVGPILLSLVPRPNRDFSKQKTSSTMLMINAHTQQIKWRWLRWQYSEDLKSGNFWNLGFLNVGFQIL